MSTSKAYHSAFDTALYYITYKDRTKKEICIKLKEKGYSSSDIDYAIEKLMLYGYINEEGYTLSYINSNVGKKSAGRILAELVQRGIDKELILEKLEDFQWSEEESIIHVLESRFSTADFEDERTKRRVYNYFLRRGFHYHTISNALSIYRKNDKNNLIL